jgi:peptidoglycan/xylan/chitin deacetylase (PgdA/CDA1 family)
MKLLILMYHRARSGRHGNSAEMLDAHFGHIANRYANTLPGEALKGEALNVVLTFDDAYFDFYALAYPLLQKHRLRALLAVVPAVLREHVEASHASRMKLDSTEAFAHPEKGGFCTWPELREMIASGHVQVAAHGQTHVRLDQPGVDLAGEVDGPKSMLEEHLGTSVNSFVFPYGRYDLHAWRRVRHRYDYAFRIGGAMNRSWDARLLYRVDADEMAGAASLFSADRLMRYRARYWWNRVRGR